MSDKTIGALEKRYKNLALKLSAVGPIVQGTITKRIISRDVKPKGKKRKNYGPYFQWTFKEAGKTVTVNLTAQQLKAFSNAISNNRKIEALLTKMRNLSRQICEASAEGVKKRLRINDNTNP
jgi:hypothetical protein